MALIIEQFPCRSDNFGVLIHDTATGLTAAIDAPEDGADPRRARREGLAARPHPHHPPPRRPHRGQPAAEGRRTAARSSARRARPTRFPGIDRTVTEGDAFAFGRIEIASSKRPATPLGHITYWMPAAKVAFVGDTLFAIGCGRVIEGTMEMMWQSLEKLAALPRDTTRLLRPRIHRRPMPASP